MNVQIKHLHSMKLKIFDELKPSFWISCFLFAHLGPSLTPKNLRTQAIVDDFRVLLYDFFYTQVHQCQWYEVLKPANLI